MAGSSFIAAHHARSISKCSRPKSQSHGPTCDPASARVHSADGGSFDSEGYFSVDETARRLEWGAEVQRDYSGWLTVAESDGNRSEVTVHLSFGPRSAEPEIQEEAPEGRDLLEEGISATLESMRRQIEEGAGKVQPPPPPPGFEPSTGENPAVVEERPPDAPQR